MPRRATKPSAPSAPATAEPLPSDGGAHLTTAQLAERWNLHAGTLKNWRSQRRGPPYVKLGTRASYPLAGVVAWEQAHRAELQGSGS